jgi:hypothetical protein
MYRESFGIRLDNTEVFSFDEGTVPTLHTSTPTGGTPTVHTPAAAAPPASVPPHVKLPAAEPTEAQLSYLKSLMSARETGTITRGFTDFETYVGHLRKSGAFTRGYVSEIIDALKKQPRRTAPAIAVPMTTVDTGYYARPDGSETRYFRVRESKTREGQVYAEELVSMPGGRWRWVYARGAVSTLAGLPKVTITDAARWGKTTGSCFVCGHRLSDPKSVAAGIGPVCSSRLV